MATTYPTYFVTDNGFFLDGVNIKAKTLDLNGTADALILDADGDTTISAPTADQIDIEISNADDFTFTANAFNVLSGSKLQIGSGGGAISMGFIPLTAQQTLANAGAVNVTSYYTDWTSTGADAGTLADGVVKGQMKKIKLTSNSGGDATLTPTNADWGTTLTFSVVGDFAILEFDGTNWLINQLGNDNTGVVTTPVAA